MPKKTSGKAHLNKLLDVSLETALAAERCVKVLYIKAMVRNSTTSDSTVEAVSIMFRFVSLVATKTGLGNHLGIK